MSQANSKRWQSPRKSVCLTFPMCRPLRKRCLVLSPSAGNAWWHRSERQTRSIKDKLAARRAYVHPATPTEAQAFVRSQQDLWKPSLEHVAMQFKTN
jgi:hypothetical protein